MNSQNILVLAAVKIIVHISATLKQAVTCLSSVADPWYFGVDPDPRIHASAYYFLKLHLKKSQKESQNSRNQGFSYYFCMMIEGSGSGRPKNTWIRIRIRNTVFESCKDRYTLEKLWWRRTRRIQQFNKGSAVKSPRFLFFCCCLRWLPNIHPPPPMLPSATHFKNGLYIVEGKVMETLLVFLLSFWQERSAYASWLKMEGGGAFLFTPIVTDATLTPNQDCY